jgi:hypothetical protein
MNWSYIARSMWWLAPMITLIAYAPSCTTKPKREFTCNCTLEVVDTTVFAHRGVSIALFHSDKGERYLVLGHKGSDSVTASSYEQFSTYRQGTTYRLSLNKIDTAVDLGSPFHNSDLKDFSFADPSGTPNSLPEFVVLRDGKVITPLYESPDVHWAQIRSKL